MNGLPEVLHAIAFQRDSVVKCLLHKIELDDPLFDPIPLVAISTCSLQPQPRQCVQHALPTDRGLAALSVLLVRLPTWKRSEGSSEFGRMKVCVWHRAEAYLSISTFMLHQVFDTAPKLQKQGRLGCLASYNPIGGLGLSFRRAFTASICARERANVLKRIAEADLQLEGSWPRFG